MFGDVGETVSPSDSAGEGALALLLDSLTRSS